MAKILNKIQPVILIVLDGWGLAPPSPGNAVELAKTPCFDRLKKKYPYTELCAHGACVGLPKNQPGNSEAGHLNLGAGRTILDDAVYVSRSIKDGTFFKNPIFLEGIRHLTEHGSKVHLMGLVTEENSAHSSPEHWLAAIDLLARENIKEIFLHLFTDGRDSGQHAAIKIIKRFTRNIKNNHVNGRVLVKIASISGRFYAMDRTKHWSRIEKVYNLLTLGEGLSVPDAEEAIVEAYNRHETDEFISPTVIKKKKKPLATIDDNDLVVFMNLRSDRARELTKAFAQKEFNQKNPGSFHRKKWSKNLFFIALTDFGPDLDNTRTAYPSRTIKNSLPIVLNGARQLYIAETEKYAHITFFINGLKEDEFKGEKRILVPSPNVASYDKKPEMSAFEIRDKVCLAIENNEFDFIVINFANPDMVGHTGNLEAAKKAVEAVSECLESVCETTLKKGGKLLITADHGNAEEMINLETRAVDKEHSNFPVPIVLAADEYKGKSAPRKNNELHNAKIQGALIDIAPTVLAMMAIDKPESMIGIDLNRLFS